jgi:hypothetical protein
MKIYETELGHAPKNWTDLKSYIQREAPHIVRAVDEREIVIIWGRPLSSGTITIYEREPDIRGTHVVAHGDASVVTMTTAELDAAVPNRER